MCLKVLKKKKSTPTQGKVFATFLPCPKDAVKVLVDNARNGRLLWPQAALTLPLYQRATIRSAATWVQAYSFHGESHDRAQPHHSRATISQFLDADKKFYLHCLTLTDHEVKQSKRWVAKGKT